jgi:hypothetical protein
MAEASLISLVLLAVFAMATYAIYHQAAEDQDEDGPDPDYSHSAIGGKLVLLYESRDPVLLSLIKSELQARSIHVVTANEQSSRLVYNLPEVTVQLLVPEEDYEPGIAVVEALTNSQWVDPDESSFESA